LKPEVLETKHFRKRRNADRMESITTGGKAWRGEAEFRKKIRLKRSNERGGEKKHKSDQWSHAETDTVKRTPEIEGQGLRGQKEKVPRKDWEPHRD